MELLQASYLHSGLFAKHRITSGRGGSHTSCSGHGDLFTIPAGLIDDPMNLSM